MESWCFGSLDKGMVPNETVSPCDSITRTKNVLDWEFKDPFGFDNNMLITSQTQQAVENSGYPEVGFAEILRTQFPHDSVRNVFNSNASVGGITSPSMATSNAISGDDESSSKLSNSVVDSISQESSLIDLKLGGFGNKPSSNSSRSAPISSSSECSVPAKRVRVTSLSSQTAYCQVYCCGRDLSSVKDYYKKHRVCEAHSKTTKVIVNGIEQRFCQQCSRFHLVAEFDDGKRSCRKRLAGHNERRRKPQVGFNSGRTGRSRHSYDDSEDARTKGSTLPLTSMSFICQEMNSFSGIQEHRRNDLGRLMKFEYGKKNAQRSENTFTDGQPQQKAVFPSFISGKQYSSLIDNRKSTELGSNFSENIGQFPHRVSIANEDSTLFNAASTIQVLPRISDSGCALSLLSSQSHLSSGPNHNVSEFSEKLIGVQNRSSSDRDTVSFNTGTWVPQASETVNFNDCISCTDESTIDLFQMSAQLERVQHQKQSRHVRQETDGFCSLRMT